MQPAAPPSRHQQTIEKSIVVRRPVAEVFSFYRDLRNLPKFLGDVLAVEQLDAVTYRWTIAGPLRTRLVRTVKLTGVRSCELIAYETLSSSKWATRWEVRFAPGASFRETRLREVMKFPLGRVGRIGLAILGKNPASEMQANLHRLKELMETGRVSDRSYAVGNKFERL